MARLIDPTEAYNRFGDLRRIRNGITTWNEVGTTEGVWKPEFDSDLVLKGYQLHPFADSRL